MRGHCERNTHIVRLTDALGAASMDLVCGGRGMLVSARDET